MSAPEKTATLSLSRTKGGKVYDEQEPDEDHAEDFTDSYGCVHMQPVMVSYNQEYAPIAVGAEADFRIIGRVL